eukprot:gene17272-22806_t
MPKLINKLIESSRILNLQAKNIGCIRCFSDSVTYSGGQANFGQGGFYGSGGARVSSTAPIHYPEALARKADIEELTKIMNDVDNIETELQSLGPGVTAKSIELKSKLKKTVSNPQVRELLNRLEIKGEPVWGLSSQERDLVRS